MSSESAAVEKKRRVSLESFVPSKILKHDTWGRATVVLGNFMMDPDGAPLATPSKALVTVHQDSFDVSSVCVPGAGAGAGASSGREGRGEEPSLTLLDMLQQPDTLALQNANDVYSYYKMRGVVGEPGADSHSRAIAAMTNIRLEIVEPANWDQISKHIAKQIVTVTETPELYAKCTLPYIADLEKKLAKKNKWIFNILDGMCLRAFACVCMCVLVRASWYFDNMSRLIAGLTFITIHTHPHTHTGTAEQDRVLCQSEGEETGYVTVVSPNWKDDLHANAFYLCLVRNRQLKSLRDLNESHLPLLKNLLEGCLAAMEDKHGLARSDVHAYFHYQPSFYQLHVHFRAFGAAVDPNFITQREYPLSEVINNIQMCGDFYQRRTLTFGSRQHEDLVVEFARVAKNTLPAPLLIVLGYDRLEAHHAAKDVHLKVFLQFVFNHFHVALIAADDSQKEQAKDIMGIALFQQLQWIDSELTAQRMEVEGVGGIISLDLPAACVAGELLSKPNFSNVSLPVHVAILNSAAPAMEESVFSHGEKLRKLLWACRHANAANIGNFIAIRNTYSAPGGEGSQQTEVQI